MIFKTRVVCQYDILVNLFVWKGEERQYLGGPGGRESVLTISDSLPLGYGVSLWYNKTPIYRRFWGKETSAVNQSSQ